MDERPLFRFDVRGYDEEALSVLSCLGKPALELDRMTARAFRRKYQRRLRKHLEAQWEEPSDLFLQYLAYQVYDGRDITPAVREHLKGPAREVLRDLARRKPKGMPPPPGMPSTEAPPPNTSSMEASSPATGGEEPGAVEAPSGGKAVAGSGAAAGKDPKASGGAEADADAEAEGAEPTAEISSEQLARVLEEKLRKEKRSKETPSTEERGGRGQ